MSPVGQTLPPTRAAVRSPIIASSPNPRTIDGLHTRSNADFFNDIRKLATVSFLIPRRAAGSLRGACD